MRFFAERLQHIKVYHVVLQSSLDELPKIRIIDNQLVLCDRDINTLLEKHLRPLVAEGYFPGLSPDAYDDQALLNFIRLVPATLYGETFPEFHFTLLKFDVAVDGEEASLSEIDANTTLLSVPIDDDVLHYPSLDDTDNFPLAAELELSNYNRGIFTRCCNALLVNPALIPSSTSLKPVSTVKSHPGNTLHEQMAKLKPRQRAAGYHSEDEDNTVNIVNSNHSSVEAASSAMSDMTISSSTSTMTTKEGKNSESKGITSVIGLPSQYWKELADIWFCHNKKQCIVGVDKHDVYSHPGRLMIGDIMNIIHINDLSAFPSLFPIHSLAPSSQHHKERQKEHPGVIIKGLPPVFTSLSSVVFPLSKKEEEILAGTPSIVDIVSMKPSVPLPAMKKKLEPVQLAKNVTSSPPLDHAEVLNPDHLNHQKKAEKIPLNTSDSQEVDSIKSKFESTSSIQDVVLPDEFVCLPIYCPHCGNLPSSEPIGEIPLRLRLDSTQFQAFSVGEVRLFKHSLYIPKSSASIEAHFTSKTSDVRSRHNLLENDQNILAPYSSLSFLSSILLNIIRSKATNNVVIHPFNATHISTPSISSQDTRAFSSKNSDKNTDRANVVLRLMVSNVETHINSSSRLLTKTKLAHFALPKKLQRMEHEKGADVVNINVEKYRFICQHSVPHMKVFYQLESEPTPQQTQAGELWSLLHNAQELRVPKELFTVLAKSLDEITSEVVPSCYNTSPKFKLSFLPRLYAGPDQN